MSEYDADYLKKNPTVFYYSVMLNALKLLIIHNIKDIVKSWIVNLGILNFLGLFIYNFIFCYCLSCFLYKTHDKCPWRSNLPYNKDFTTAYVYKGSRQG